MTDKPNDIPRPDRTGAAVRTVDDADNRAHETKVDVQAEAQKSKMANADPIPHPNQVPRTNQPNAGGTNRETGNRRG